MAQAIILLPSTVTRAMRALQGVLGAIDLHEYLSAEVAAQLRATSTLLQRTLETTLQVCEDPAHERQVIAQAKARLRAHAAWLREARRRQRKEARLRRRAQPGEGSGHDPVGGGSVGS